VSSLVDHASRFDADVTLVKHASVGLRKVIAAAKRMLDMHERGVRHQNIYWEEYLSQRRRLMVHQRAAWLCKLMLSSLIRLFFATFRASLSGAVWLLHYFRYRIVTRSSSLAESADLDKSVAGIGWAKLKTRLAALLIAAISLAALGMVFTAKPITDVELVLQILPETQGSTTTTSAAKDGAFYEAAYGSIASTRVDTGLAPRAFSSDTVPGHLPAVANDSASAMLHTPQTIRTQKTTSGSTDPVLAEDTEARPQLATGTTSSISTTTVSAPAEVVDAAPAILRPVADGPQPDSGSPQHRQKSSTSRERARNFVPHANW
jgi:hypothetical protein